MGLSWLYTGGKKWKGAKCREVMMLTSCPHVHSWCPRWLCCRHRLIICKLLSARQTRGPPISHLITWEQRLVQISWKAMGHNGSVGSWLRDRDWRHCPACPHVDNGLTCEYNDCAAKSGRRCVFVFVCVWNVEYCCTAAVESWVMSVCPDNGVSVILRIASFTHTELSLLAVVNVAFPLRSALCSRACWSEASRYTQWQRKTACHDTVASSQSIGSTSRKIQTVTFW